MIILIQIFGVLTLLMGIIIMINPEATFCFLVTHLGQKKLLVLSAVTRFILSIVLILNCSISRFPILVELTGWVCFVAATILTVMGPKNFGRLISLISSHIKTFGKAGGVFTLAFGTFLICAFI